MKKSNQTKPLNPVNLRKKVSTFFAKKFRKFSTWIVIFILIGTLSSAAIFQTEIFAPDKTIWGNLSDVIGALIGVPFGMAGALIAIWLAFRVESISERQLYLENLSTLNREMNIACRQDSQYFTGVNREVFKRLNTNAALLESHKALKDACNAEWRRCTVINHCKSCGNETEEKGKHLLQLEELMYRNEKLLNRNDFQLAIAFINLPDQIKFDISEKIFSETKSNKSNDTKGAAIQASKAIRESFEKNESFETLSFGKNFAYYFDRYCIENLYLTIDDEPCQDEINALIDPKHLAEGILLLLLSEEKATIDTNEHLEAEVQQHLSDLQKQGFINRLEYKKPLPKYKTSLKKEITISNNYTMESNIFDCIAQELSLFFDKERFYIDIKSIGFDNFPPDVVEAAKEKEYNRVVDAVEECNNMYFSHLSKYSQNNERTALRLNTSVIHYELDWQQHNEELQAIDDQSRDDIILNFCEDCGSPL